MTKLAEKSQTAVGKAPKARGRAAETKDVTPRLAGKVERKRPPPQLEASPAFMWTHNPEKWTVIGGEVVPALSKGIKLIPGVNGVQENKDGEIIATAAIDDAVNNGLTIIPWDVEGPGTTYLRSPKDAPHVVISKFERVYSGSNKIDSDEPAYVAFCRGLVANGVVAPCPDYVLARMESDLVKQIGELELKPGQGAFRALLERNLAGVRKAIGANEPEPAETEPVTPGTKP